MTRMGVIMGTAAYMSPEQTKGKPLAKRADIWAFGCVLLEMPTGKRAFDGEDVSDTLAFIITKEPDWPALPAATPSSIRRLLRRSVEKDRKRRLSDTADARLEIDEATAAAATGEGVARAPVVRVAPYGRRVLPWAVASALGVGLALALLLWWAPWRPLPAAAAPLRLEVARRRRLAGRHGWHRRRSVEVSFVNFDKSGRIGLCRLDQEPVVFDGMRQSEPRVSIVITASGDGKLWPVRGALTHRPDGDAKRR